MRFEEWFRQELQRLLRLATVLCGSPDLAQDLVQDVALKVEQRWAKLSGLEYRDAYVRRMLVNEHLTFRRRFSRVSVRAVVEPSHRGGSPDFTDQQADRAALLEELRRLPPRQRAVVVLRYFDDADDDTIAQILGCRRSTVRSHAARALETLRINSVANIAEQSTKPSTDRSSGAIGTPDTFHARPRPDTKTVPADGEEDSRAN